MCLSKIHAPCYAENKMSGKGHGLRGNLMKKQTWLEILVVLALVAGWFYMEKTNSLTVFDKEDMTKEEILAEMPEIAVTKKDEALEDYVMGVPEVQELLAQPDGGKIHNDELEAFLADFLGQEDALVSLSVAEHQVNVNLYVEKDVKKRIFYTFDGAGEQPMQKTIWKYEQRWDGERTTAIYEVCGDTYEKMTGRHDWFSWIIILFR